MTTRRQNERKFGNWQELAAGGRRYWYDVERSDGFTIRYVKFVDEKEVTTAIVQEFYDVSGILVEVHEKFPVDRGHRRV